jgi:hypothetical protein
MYDTIYLGLWDWITVSLKLVLITTFTISIVKSVKQLHSYQNVVTLVMRELVVAFPVILEKSTIQLNLLML